MEQISKEQANRLKGLSKHDKQMIESMLELRMMNVDASGLDPKTFSLCRIASLVAMDAPLTSYAWQVGAALESGVTADDIVGVLIALAPTVGFARVAGAATKLAIVFDIEIEPGELAA